MDRSRSRHAGMVGVPNAPLTSADLPWARRGSRAAFLGSGCQSRAQKVLNEWGKYLKVG